MQSRYSIEDIAALLNSDFTTPQTQAVLEARMAQPKVTAPQFFNQEQFRILGAVCERLIPQPQEKAAIDLPGLFDTKLKEGAGKGWRYNALPADKILFTAGLTGIDEAASAMTGAGFYEASATDQDKILAAVQEGKAPGQIWESLPAKLFFEELLAALVEIYYSHPLAKAAISDLSFADAPGWQHIGLNETDEQQKAIIS